MAWPKGRKHSEEAKGRMSAGHLARHAVMEKGVKVCEVCGRECKGRQGLAVHMGQMHKVKMNGAMT